LNEKLINYEDVEKLKSQLKISPIAFKYDGVYNESNNGSQEILFQQNIKHLIDEFLNGKNGSVLIFGPSSSGKTYTLKGG
jgi:hypothetical protein